MLVFDRLPHWIILTMATFLGVFIKCEKFLRGGPFWPSLNHATSKKVSGALTNEGHACEKKKVGKTDRYVRTSEKKKRKKVVL